MGRSGCILSVLISMLLFTGCSESDIVSVRIQLNTDLSGTITTSSLQVPSAGGALERRSSGVNWNNRLNVVIAASAFSNLGELRLEDIQLAGCTGL